MNLKEAGSREKLMAITLMLVVGVGILIQFFDNHESNDEPIRSWGFAQAFSTSSSNISFGTTTTTTL